MGLAERGSRVATYIFAIWAFAFVLRLFSTADALGLRYLSTIVWLDLAQAVAGAALCVGLTWLPNDPAKERSYLMVLFAVGVILAGDVALSVFGTRLFCQIRPHFVMCANQRQRIAIRIRNDLWLYLICYLLSLISKHYARRVVRERYLQDCRRVALKAQTDALILKLRPRLIIAALDRVRRLLRRRRPEAAAGMILGIAEFMRRSVSWPAAGPTSLAAEADYVKSYLALERGGRNRDIDFVSDIPADLEDAQVPARVLNLIVTEIVEQTPAGRGKRASLRLTAARVDGRLVVRLLERAAPGAERPDRGATLQAAVSRLVAEYGDQAALDCEARFAGERVFQIRLPLVHGPAEGPARQDRAGVGGARRSLSDLEAEPEDWMGARVQRVRAAEFVVRHIRTIALGLMAAVAAFAALSFIFAMGVGRDSHWTGYISTVAVSGLLIGFAVVAGLVRAGRALSDANLYRLSAGLVIGAGAAIWLIEETARSLVFFGRLGQAHFLFQVFERASLIYAAVCFAYLYVRSLEANIAGERRLAELTAEAIRSRNSMLRYQLQPHFLFNAMNALYALMLDRRWAQADDMARVLSELVQISFGADQGEFAPLAAQIEAFEAYLAIEKIRFGERLVFVRNIPEDLRQAQAPALILQPLVENAMKHAVATTVDPVEVEISATRAGDSLVLAVRDSGGDPDAPQRPGLGVGLRNVAARLAGHYGARGSLRCERLAPKGFVAEIRLPLEFAGAATAA